MHGHQGCPSIFAHTSAPALNGHVGLQKYINAVSKSWFQEKTRHFQFSQLPEKKED